MLTSEVCWCVFSITIVYLSLFFLASNPLIILTDPSLAKIQNQHTQIRTASQAGRLNILYFTSPHFSPPWPFSWVESVLAVLHSVAATVSCRDPGLMDLTLGVSDCTQTMLCLLYFLSKHSANYDNIYFCF